MSAATGFDVLLVVAILGAAVFAAFGKPRIHATVMFLVFGVLLAVVWARLEAPDVAIAEAVLGAGVTGALLMAAVTAAPRPPPGDARMARPLVLAAGVLALVLAVALSALVLRLQVVPGVGADIEENLAPSGVEHPVTAVLLNFRSYDTLLEVAVLAVAVFAALALWGDFESGTSLTARRTDPGPLGAMARLLVPVLVLVIGWFLVAGSTRPGGAFQAGALLAGGLVMMYLAGIGSGQWVRRWLRPLLVAGLGAFLLLAFGTAALGEGWLTMNPAWAGTAILAVEAALTASIGATLAALFVCTQKSAMSGGDDR